MDPPLAVVHAILEGSLSTGASGLSSMMPHCHISVDWVAFLSNMLHVTYACLTV